MNAYSKEEILSWYQDYRDHTNTARSISQKFQVKHETMIKAFKKLGLTVRIPGFRIGNFRGIPGIDLLRLHYLWFYKFSYKRRALRKSLSFTLLEDDFIALVTSNCHYCGVSHLSETRNVNKNKVHMLTVDRMDSSKGYIKENCVSACKRCNTIKMDMPYNDFIDQINKITRHLNKSL